MIMGRKPIGTVSYMGGLPAVLEPFCWSLANLMIHSTETLCGPDDYIHLAKSTYSDHAPARNGLAKKMVGDWILMLDTDHSFEPDLLVRLLHRMDQNKFDVVLGVYQYKTYPHAPVLFMREGEQKMVSVLCNWYSKEGKAPDILRVDSAGGGCMLIKREVFERIHDELKEEPFNRVEGLSEDHSFFWRLHVLKIPVWCDMRVECNHLQVRPVGLDDFARDELLLSEPKEVPGYRD